MIMGGRVPNSKFQVGFATPKPPVLTRFGIASLQHVRGGHLWVLVMKFSEGFRGKFLLFF